MSDPFQISPLQAMHNAYDVFHFTLEALASAPERQCELMGDYNTAWALRDDTLCARYLVGTGFLSESQEAAVLALLDQVEPLPVDTLPSGSGRAVNLAAMQDPAWEPVRVSARCLLETLAPVTAANRAYLGTA